MTQRPVAAGKSSLDHVDQELAFAHIVAGAGATYLDLASGAGRYSLALAGRLEGCGVIHAFDLWDEGIAALAQRAKDEGLDTIKPQVVDMTRPLPLGDAAVDVCFIATALHDIPEQKRAAVVEEVRRVLAPGGALVLIEFKKLDRGPGPSRERRIGEEDADALVLPRGFEKGESVSLGEFTYLAKYSKA